MRHRSEREADFQVDLLRESSFLPIFEYDVAQEIRLDMAHSKNLIDDFDCSDCGSKKGDSCKWGQPGEFDCKIRTRDVCGSRSSQYFNRAMAKT